jgi:response regulator RpfG family c-di-GMP phosphodiesterase
MSEIRFMIIDDDPGNNMLCEILIKKTIGEADIQTFTEPAIAVDFIRKEYSNGHAVHTVVLLDINMPVMTGWDVLEKFKTFDESIKRRFNIYLVSSSIDQRDKERAKENPIVADYIEKPLTAEMLRKIADENQSLSFASTENDQ